MEVKMQQSSFGERLKSMLRVDLRRMFTMRLLYIMVGASFVIPILTLVMTSAVGGSGGGMFTNVWQIVSSVSGAGGAGMMDITAMCNINLMYFGAAVLVCLFVSEDFKSGYAKNLFTVRAGRGDYILSKMLTCFLGCTMMLLAFFAGSMIGGAIGGLPFELGAVTIGNVVMCMLCKIFLMAVFAAIFLFMSIFAKQKTWLAMIGSFVVSMLLFMMIPAMTPLNAVLMNVALCFAGGALFSIGFGTLGRMILKKRDIL